MYFHFLSLFFQQNNSTVIFYSFNQIFGVSITMSFFKIAHKSHCITCSSSRMNPSTIFGVVVEPNSIEQMSN